MNGYQGLSARICWRLWPDVALPTTSKLQRHTSHVATRPIRCCVPACGVRIGLAGARGRSEGGSGLRQISSRCLWGHPQSGNVSRRWTAGVPCPLPWSASPPICLASHHRGRGSAAKESGMENLAERNPANFSSFLGRDCQIFPRFFRNFRILSLFSISCFFLAICQFFPTFFACNPAKYFRAVYSQTAKIFRVQFFPPISTPIPPCVPATIE